MKAPVEKMRSPAIYYVQKFILQPSPHKDELIAQIDPFVLDKQVRHEFKSLLKRCAT